MSRSITRTITLYNRMRRCTFLKERETYASTTEKLIETVLRSTSSYTSSNLITEFQRVFNSRAFTGNRNVLHLDRTEFRSFNLKCLNTLIKISSRITLPLHQRVWKNIKTAPMMLVSINDYVFTLQISAYNWAVTEEKLDFYCLNNYIYNRSSELRYPGLVLSLPEETYFDISSCNTEDYTTIRGLTTTILKNRTRIQGKHCQNCKNQCKPKVINGLDRLLISEV